MVQMFMIILERPFRQQLHHQDVASSRCAAQVSPIRLVSEFRVKNRIETLKHQESTDAGG